MADRKSKVSGADHSVMRELNRSLVLDLLKEKSPLSRAAIAKVTNLAKPTVSAIVEDLITEGLVREIGVGQPNQGGGRPPILLEFNRRSQYIAGVHIGVRRTTVSLADAMGEEIGRLQKPTVRGKPQEALKRIAALVRETLSTAGVPRKRLAAVGVGVPGLVDMHSGLCLLAPNLGWRDVNVSEPLEEALGVSIYVHNIAQAAAVAENLEGAGQGVADLVFLYVGSGVGAGILTGGRLYHGADGIAGEIGHCTVPGGTEKCNCGKIGCLETVTSGPAIAREAARASAGVPGPLSDAVSKGRLDAEQVAAAAEAGDEIAIKVLAEAGRELGVAASWLVNLFNPEVLVVGGGVAGAGEPFLGPLREAALELALPQAANGLEIRTSTLGPDARVRGAVHVARQYAETYYRVVFQG